MVGERPMRAGARDLIVALSRLRAQAYPLETLWKKKEKTFLGGLEKSRVRGSSTRVD